MRVRIASSIALSAVIWASQCVSQQQHGHSNRGIENLDINQRTDGNELAATAGNFVLQTSTSSSSFATSSTSASQTTAAVIADNKHNPLMTSSSPSESAGATDATAAAAEATSDSAEEAKSTDEADSGKKKSNTGAIVGGVVGGVVGLLVILGAGFFFYRRRRSSRSRGFAQQDSMVALEKTRASSSTNATAIEQIATSPAGYEPPRHQDTLASHTSAASHGSNANAPAFGSQTDLATTVLNKQRSGGNPGLAKERELLVNEDGVSIRSASPDLGSGLDERGIPRLPMYRDGEESGRSSAAL